MKHFLPIANLDTKSAMRAALQIPRKSVNSSAQANGTLLMRKALLVAAVLLVSSTPPAVAGWFSDPEGASSKDRVVCKTRTKSGNTRFTNRVCRTAQEWDWISEASKRSANELVNRPIIEGRQDPAEMRPR